MTELNEVEEVLDSVIRVNVVKSFFSANKTLLIGAGAVLAVGVASHILTKKRLERKYEQIAADDIKAVKEHYTIVHSTPEEVAEKPALEDLVNELGYKTIIEKPKKSNYNPEPAFVPMPDEAAVISIWDQENEEIKRLPDLPYIISADEFQNDVTGHQQVTFTYFEGDDVLVDERSQLVTDIEGLVGVDNLYKFGHGSQDPHVVYIRHEKIDMEFEITRSTGKYAEEVQGFFEHAEDDNRVRKFRTRNE